MDFVLQGNLTEATKSVVSNMMGISYLDRLILSCWEGEDASWYKDSKITIVQSKDIENPGIGNRNRQIKSSLEGIKVATAPEVAKFRTDQIISVDSLEMMGEYFYDDNVPKLRYSNDNGPQTQMFVAGIFAPFPFHPRDHLFFGGRQDLLRLFDIPYCKNPPTSTERYNEFSRAECYIGTHYAKHFIEECQIFLDNEADYLTDNGKFRDIAMKLSNEYRDKIFRVFPKISFSWPKHNMPQYHYWHTQNIEYQAN